MLRSKNIKNNIRKNCKNKNNNKRQYHSNLDDCMKYCIRFRLSFEMINSKLYRHYKLRYFLVLGIRLLSHKFDIELWTSA